MIASALAVPTQSPAVDRLKIGTQDYPENPALDTWAKNSECPTVPTFFRMAVAKNPSGPYLGAKVGKNYEFLTYKEVEKDVEHFSSALIQAGIQRGDRVAIFAENSPHTRVTDFGIAYAGGVLTGLLAEYADRTVEYTLHDSQSKVLVVDTKERLEQVLRAEPKLPDLQTIVVTGKFDLSNIHTSKRLVPWNDFMADGARHLEGNRAEIESRISKMRAQDIGRIVYTSGSTGDPKGVLLSHGNVLSAVEGMVRRVNNDPTVTLKTARRDDLYPSILPQGHVMGAVGDYAMTAEGGSIAYPASLLAFRKDLPHMRATVLGVTPLFFDTIYDGVRREAVRDTSPVVPPKVAGMAAGVAGAAFGALAGGLIGSGLSGAGLAWTLALAGATVSGAAADHAATRTAQTWTGAHAFEKAMATSKKYYQSHGTASLATRMGHWLGQKLVFSKVRSKLDQRIGSENRILLSGGAALNDDSETMFRAAGYRIAQGYGLSETCGGGLMNDPNGGQLGTAGTTLDGMEVRIAPDGEIQLRGPSVMSGGYLNKQQQTQESFTQDGFYRTGDTGRIIRVKQYPAAWKVGAGITAFGAAVGAIAGAMVGDPLRGALFGGAFGGGYGLIAGTTLALFDRGEDYLVVEGRIKNQFKLPGGEYVTPEPIENDLRGSPFIKDAIVVGIKGANAVGALIVPKFDNLEVWARQRNLPTEPKAMVAQPEVVTLLKDEAAARSTGHQKHEVVRAVSLLDHEFSGDEVTATKKLSRPVILKHYAEQLDAMK